MEFITDRLPSEVINSYASAYRTVAVSMATTPANNNFRLYFEDLKVCTERDLIWAKDHYFIWLMSSFVPFADRLERPWMIVNGDTVLFDKITFTDEEIKLMHVKGLNIFMYEPLFLCNSDRTWPWSQQSGVPLFAELEGIDNLRQRLGNIPITVYICEYGMSEYLTQNNVYPDLKFIDFSTLLMHQVILNSSHTWQTVPFEKIEKNVLSMNFRHESFREMLVGYLRGKNLHNNCFLSFYHSHDLKNLKKRLSFDPQTLTEWPVIHEGIAAMQPELPYVLDATNAQLMAPVQGFIPDFTGANQRDLGRVKEFMGKSFAFAYCESRPLSPRGELSEKTVYPILAMRPFVIFGAPGLMRTLRTLGFQTFSDLWDESFDLIEDPKERFSQFLKTVEYIASQDLETLKDWGRRITPALEHNRLYMMRYFIENEQRRIETQFQRPH